MRDRITFLFVGNGPYSNRGCEAIVRGTVKILRRAFGDCNFINANFGAGIHHLVHSESDNDIIHRPVQPPKRWSPEWICWQLLKRLNNDLSCRLYLRSLSEHIRKADAVLSLGGDNYTLDYSIPWLFMGLDKFVLKHKRPQIIWGASIGPFDSKPKFADAIHRHLRDNVTLIFVREKTSFEYLHSNGIKDNVYLMADPAFLMEPEPISSEQLEFEMPQKAIGLNLSPLMARHIPGKSREALTKIGVDLVEGLRSKLQMSVVLIPHVTSPHSNDHWLLDEIYKKLKSKNDIYLLPGNLNAAQVKCIISKLACLVASRTHATIAAFSTFVPTVSLAYSAKAYGINKMLFGHTLFVVRPEDFYPERILKKVTTVLHQESQIRKTLEFTIPGIQNLAWGAGIQLKKIFEN